MFAVEVIEKLERLFFASDQKVEVILETPAAWLVGHDFHKCRVKQMNKALKHVETYSCMIRR